VTLVRLSGIPGLSVWCDTDTRHLAQAEAVEVGGGEAGLKEALLTKGPLTVSVDAAPDSFRFYKSGVYKNPACHTKIDGAGRGGGRMRPRGRVEAG
jgi:Papain family cysteine protease